MFGIKKAKATVQTKVVEPVKNAVILSVCAIVVAIMAFAMAISAAI